MLLTMFFLMKFISPNFSDLMEPNITIKQFPDGDNYIKLPETKEKQVTLFHRLWPNQDNALLQAFLMLSTLKKSRVKTTLVSPYLPYARQDKIFKQGEALSSEEVCKLLAYCGTDKLITLDCHFLKKQGDFEYGNLNIKNISMADKLISYTKSKINNEPLEILSPDLGASYMVPGGDKKSMKKIRGEYVEGEEAYRKIEKVENKVDVNDKNVLILDDMIASGGTMIRAIENVKNGGAKKVLCAATHGFFLKGSLEKLNGLCDEVFVTDSIATEVSKIKIIDVLKDF